jgi:hypothetical protein
VAGSSARQQSSLKIKNGVCYFLTVSILYFLLSFFVGWIPFSLKGFAIDIWTAFYLYFRFQMKIMNEGIDKRRD